MTIATEDSFAPLPIPGARFHGCYRVVRPLRAGGAGAVYDVIDERTNRHRALKVLLPELIMDAESRARFELEARATGRVSSEHLVDVLDAGVDDDTGLPFLVMDLLAGEDLGVLLARRGKLAWDEMLLLLGQIASALDRVHGAGLVHRDLKPDNLFICRHDDGSQLVKLLDFGAVKVVVSRTGDAHTTRNLGTPLYMAPEQLEGDGRIDGRADVWALAQLVYTMLVGQAYFAPEATSSGGVYPVLLAVGRGAREPASVRAGRVGIVLPRGFDAWFARATARDAAARFATAAAAFDALKVAGSARGRFSIGRWLAGPRSTRLLVAAGCACAMAVVLAASFHQGASPVRSHPPTTSGESELRVKPADAPVPSAVIAARVVVAPSPAALDTRSAPPNARASSPRVAQRKPRVELNDDPSDFR